MEVHCLVSHEVNDIYPIYWLFFKWNFLHFEVPDRVVLKCFVLVFLLFLVISITEPKREAGNLYQQICPSLIFFITVKISSHAEQNTARNRVPSFFRTKLTTLQFSDISSYIECIYRMRFLHISKKIPRGLALEAYG